MVGGETVDGATLPGEHHPPILVIGLGNPILGDDGVGWRVAEGVAARLGVSTDGPTWNRVGSGPLFREDIEVDCLAVGGLGLMERLIGYERAIIIDAITTGQVPDGKVISFPLDALPDTAQGHMTSAHDTSLQTALTVGRSMGATLPQDITIVGIETRQIYDFSENFSPPVSASIPEAVDLVMELLK